jgi:hypothetical protein
VELGLVDQGAGDLDETIVELHTAATDRFRAAVFTDAERVTRRF